MEKEDRIVVVARLRLEGHSNAEIAEMLGVPKRMIEQDVWQFSIQPDGRILRPDGLPA